MTVELLILAKCLLFILHLFYAFCADRTLRRDQNIDPFDSFVFGFKKHRKLPSFELKACLFALWG
ncbi:hypothetical protein BDW62DRAFT_176530 [Aspergillus aurantiobrunneus]